MLGTCAESNNGLKVDDIGLGSESPLAKGQDTVARCIAIDGKRWYELLAWATGSGKVTAYDLRVANTVAGYAGEDWKKKPSEKQARIAIRVIDAAERNGIQVGNA